MKLIMENWKRFLNEDEHVDDDDYAEQELRKMEPTQRKAFIEAVDKAVQLHLHSSEEGAVEYVLDDAGMPGAKHLETLVRLFLGEPAILFGLKRKLDLDAPSTTGL
jgi:hypothetical protein